jgi:hypothetical protein
MNENMIKFWYEVSPDQAAIVVSLLKSEAGIEAKPLGARRSSRFGKSCGPGFGDKVWRVNYADNVIEVSFARPCAESKLVKSLGFRWHHAKGVWFSPNEEKYADMLAGFQMKQIDPVLAPKA